MDLAQNPPLAAWSLSLLVVAGCPADGDGEDGNDDAMSIVSDGSVGDPTGGDDAATATGSDTTGLDPMCADIPPAADGSTLDLGKWTPVLDFDSQGLWDGTCTVTAVAAGSTTLDCSADPEGPATMVATWTPSDAAPPWQVDDAVDVTYHLDGWSDGEYFGMRTSPEGALLLAFGYGGGDGGLPNFGPLIAPITYDENLEACGMAGPGQRFPAEITFFAEDGTSHPLMQGDTATLAGAAGDSYQVTLHTAEEGDFNNDHYGSFYDVVIERLP